MAEVILDGDTLVATDEFVLKPSEPALPDLVAKYFFAPDNIKKPLRYWTFTIETNEGMVDAKGHQARIYLSEDDTLDAGDKLLANKGTGMIEVGDFFLAPMSIKVPKNTDTGTQYLIVKVDAKDKIEEQDEVNNVLSKEVNVTPF
jgi:hypothetical protein